MSEALSVVVLTQDEETFIGRCIRSVPFADEVVVLDSGSTDRTREIAEGHGAVFFERPWAGNWARQRNKGVSLAENDWVLYLDADEIVTPKLAASIQEVLREQPDIRDGYYMTRRPDHLGRLLPNLRRPSRRKGMVRLFNRRYNSFDESMDVHEECHPVGKAISLEGDLLHWRGRTMREDLESLNFYTDKEADAVASAAERVSSARILIRPVLRFLWDYVARGSFRSGVPGLIHALMKAFHEFGTAAKVWERQHVPDPVLHPPEHVYHDPKIAEERGEEYVVSSDSTEVDEGSATSIQRS